MSELAETPHHVSASGAETLRDLLRAGACSRADAPALLGLGKRPLSHSDLLRQVEGVSRALAAAGIRSGDRVAICLPDGPEMATAFVGVSAVAASAPLNPGYREEEFTFYLADLGARALLLSAESGPARRAAQRLGVRVLELVPDPDRAGVLGLFPPGGSEEPLPAAGPDDVALLLHTSGTTSRPKLVPLTHRNLLASADSIARTLELTSRDRCLNVMPLFHIHGLVGALLASLAAGGSIVCTPGLYAPQFFDWIEEFGPTWYTAVPTMHQAILSRAKQNAHVLARARLRFVRSSSAALPPQVLTELESVFQVPVIEAYGMTEASHQMASNPLPPAVRKPGTVGLAAGPEIAILGEEGQLLAPGHRGEIGIRGASVTSGYVNNPVANEQGFTGAWFRTGDQGFLDADGYLTLTGRLKEIINRGGEKFSPREIDEVLLEHPAVVQAVVFGFPDPRLGEDLAAAVVLRKDAAVTERELREFVAGRVAAFKVPGRVVFIAEVPKGPTGKVQRIGLAAKLGISTEAASSKCSEPVAPRNAVEESLRGIWRDVLRVENIGVEDNFFALGGDSILATQVLSRIQRTMGVKLPLIALFEIRTIAAMARELEGHPKSLSLETIKRRPQGRPVSFPLSFGQERLWFLCQLYPGTPFNNSSRALALDGPLDDGALGSALDEILRRHEVLRTVFASKDGQGKQILSPHRSAALAVVDLTGLPEAEREAEVRRLASEEADALFDLTRGPLWRVCLYSVGRDRHVFQVTSHHLVSDGWSIGVFFRELSALYAAFVSGEPSPLAELPVQYADYAVWQREWMQGDVLEKHLSYWRSQLAGLPALELPTDRSGRGEQSFRGGRHSVTLPRSLNEALRELSQRESVTLYMTLLAAFQALLSRYSGQEDIVVGSPIANRTRTEIEGLIGFFANTLVMRTDLSGDPTFRELLQRVREVALGAYAHQDLPFEKLVEELRPERDLGQNPLFQVTFALQDARASALELAGLAVIGLHVQSRTTRFELEVDVRESDGLLTCVFVYSTDLFDASTIERMSRHFQILLEGCVADPDLRVSKLSLLTEAERQQVLFDWNRTETEYPRDRTLQDVFEEQAERTPQAEAVVFGEQRLTYGQLNARANRVARYLRTRGVGPEVLVGLCVERSLETIVGFLGILKAGGAYLPLDPTYPRERLRLVLEETSAPVVLTQASLLGSLPAGSFEPVRLDADWPRIARESGENLPGRATPENLAYVLYTSGSTGTPKGVAISHAGIGNQIFWFAEAFPLAAEDRFLQTTALSFDASIREFFAPLLAGACLVIANPQDDRDPASLVRTISGNEITILQLVPSLLRMLLDQDEFRGCTSLKHVFCGGEALTHDLQVRFFENLGAQLHNLYGPTEASIAATFWTCRRANDGVTVPIGRPIANTQIYVLDGSLNPVPVGVPGELWIGGAGLARGYLNRPELTAQRFVPNPIVGEAGSRIYRSGDLARYQPDGKLELLGRLDYQIKLRGFRIEPGEIESILAQHHSVAESVVIAREDVPGDKRLVAYVVGEGGAPPPIAELRAFLKRVLPEYMVPSLFVVLESLPLTPSGKVDRHALSAPDKTRPELEDVFVAPRNPVEQTVAGIWGQVLGLEKVGIHDNFFELGGHSLLATQVISRVRTAFQVELPLRLLFDWPTIAEFAGVIEETKSDGAKPRGAVLGPVVPVSREEHRMKRSAAGVLKEIGRT